MNPTATRYQPIYSLSLQNTIRVRGENSVAPQQLLAKLSRLAQNVFLNDSQKYENNIRRNEKLDKFQNIFKRVKIHQRHRNIVLNTVLR